MIKKFSFFYLFSYFLFLQLVRLFFINYIFTNYFYFLFYFIFNNIYMVDFDFFYLYYHLDISNYFINNINLLNLNNFNFYYFDSYEYGFFYIVFPTYEFSSFFCNFFLNYCVCNIFPIFITQELNYLFYQDITILCKHFDSNFIEHAYPSRLSIRDFVFRMFLINEISYVYLKHLISMDASPGNLNSDIILHIVSQVRSSWSFVLRKLFISFIYRFY